MTFTHILRAGWLGLGFVLLASVQVQVKAADTVTAEQATIARGAYLARAGDCMACHTVTGGQAFAGGLPIHSPMGTIYSTNITPDPQHGIGRYTEQQFGEALRKGVRADGKHLYPAMPYPDYKAITADDIHALYTYFMKGVTPVAKALPPTDLAFPFSQRWGMALWNLAFTSGKPFVTDGSKSAEFNRGKYLVQTLGHCSSCHTSRGIAMQEQALDDSSDKFLDGGSLNHWATPSLRGMPGWTERDIVDYLATGRNDFSAVGGEMTAVVEQSTQHMTEQDLRAIAVYLKTLSPTPASTALQRPDADAATARTTKMLADSRNLDTGALLYMNNCQACHATDGKGAKGIFPQLNGARIVVQKDPTALIDIVLKGAQTPSTERAPSILPMPGFEHRLNNQQVADLVNFLRKSWANDAPAISADAVATVRRDLK